MPITLRERDTSRAVRYGIHGGEETLRFIAAGSADQTAIYAAVLAESPPLWDGFIRREIRLQPLGDDSTWEVEVAYGPTGQDGTTDPVGSDPSPSTAPSNSDPLRGGYAFDLTADTLHITQSLRTIGRIAPGAELAGNAHLTVVGDGLTVSPAPHPVQLADAGQTVWITGGAGWVPGGYRIVMTDVLNQRWILDRSPAPIGSTGGVWKMLPQAPDYQGAIGVSEERIEGCDIFGPRFEWSRTISLTTVTRAYLMTLRTLVGTKNRLPFYGAHPGEVLYLGATGAYSQGERWSITHRFSEISNQSNLEIRPGLIVPSKRGWDYLWVRYAPEIIDQQILQRAAAAYVEEVVPDGDFTLLGIGA